MVGKRVSRSSVSSSGMSVSRCKRILSLSVSALGSSGFWLASAAHGHLPAACSGFSVSYNQSCHSSAGLLGSCTCNAASSEAKVFEKPDLPSSRGPSCQFHLDRSRPLHGQTLTWCLWTLNLFITGLAKKFVWVL